MAHATLSLVDTLFLARFGIPVRRTTRDAQRGSTKAYVPLTMGSSHNRKGRKRPWASPKLDQATKLFGIWELGTDSPELGNGNWYARGWKDVPLSGSWLLIFESEPCGL